MKKAWFLALLLPTCAAATTNVSGYAQEHFSYRTESKSRCATLAGCGAMVNEQRVQLLAEWHGAGAMSATLRADAMHDGAVGRSSVLLREGYLDWTVSPRLSLRAGRQVITWGVSDYLFVNDIFPKNYDAFFTGKPFDHMKEAVDALKANAVAGGNEIDLVVARPGADQAPSEERFVATAPPAAMRFGAAQRLGADIAARLARRLGRWDAAFYLARYHSRDTALNAERGMPRWEMHTLRHAGASVTGPLGSGVLMAELAYMNGNARAGNMNRFFVGSQVKVLLGYSAELGDDFSASLQYHHEMGAEREVYRRSLAPGVAPVSRHRQTVYFKLHKKFNHQTLGLGIQGFAALDGGNYLNPFAMYAIADGLNLEAGANLFGGTATSRYGTMKHDSNAYASLRYSF
jgi:hypothetical protein